MDVFLFCCLPDETDSLNLGLTVLARLCGQASLLWGSCCRRVPVGLLSCGCQIPDSGPHAAGTLPTEQTPRPHHSSLFKGGTWPLYSAILLHAEFSLFSFYHRRFLCLLVHSYYLSLFLLHHSSSQPIEQTLVDPTPK